MRNAKRKASSKLAAPLGSTAVSATRSEPAAVKPRIPQATVAPRLLTIPQAAAYLSSAIWCVRQLLWAKQIPHIRMGRRFCVDKTDLDKWVEMQKEAAA
jgi:excisionase family DNA binding protein